jgi:hypothetical protein
MVPMVLFQIQAASGKRHKILKEFNFIQIGKVLIAQRRLGT